MSACALPFIAVPLGAVPGSGTIDFTSTIPLDSLPPGIEGVTLYAQVLTSGTLSAPTAVAIVDDGV